MSGAAWAVLLSAAVSAARVPAAVSPLVKVRPGAVLPEQHVARLSLARGECEGLQVVVPGPVEHLEVSPLSLRGPGAPLRADLWRVGYLNVAIPSNSQGATGPWPDALLPLDAPAPGPHLPVVVYVEFCAPTSQGAGTYRGQFMARMDGVEQTSLSFSVEVQPFVLPITPSLPTSFGISRYSIARGHHLPAASPEAQALLRDYARVLLEHRLSAHGMGMDPPPVTFGPGDEAEVDWTDYDAEMAPFLEGTVLPSGARFTTLEVRDSPRAQTEAQKVAYYRAFSRHVRQKGWPAQLFFYTKDEPKPEDIPIVLAQSRRARAAGGILVLVTSPLEEALRNAADILAPPINCFYPRSGPQTCRTVVEMGPLRQRLPSGTKVWWYQSCISHGCGGGGSKRTGSDEAYTGWASYMVDHSTPTNRAMGVLAFGNGVEGELYFDTVFAYNTKRDPWTDLFEFGGNGDGTLFYPGTPARLGQSGHHPVPSLRLKNIRDGLEDYEYLRLLAQLGDATFARDAAYRLARTGWDIRQDAREWEQVRQVVTARLRQRWTASEFAKRPSRHTPGSTP
ncbi:DUF4091 domain-containing protein [Myxococcus sp. K15C18031901]|uniref:DUF4091 domain-containing protein n=1 Tax=Myxococcus dinghuensis TaxID=2906761 RepID=UPI0020A7ED89|nr:DUF4091 domain-containing protein [Myxococcus dinghuensis]MCP3103180.1 DUF4091 domain-containing protein [Myxococcus dinghuensis]